MCRLNNGLDRYRLEDARVVTATVVSRTLVIQEAVGYRRFLTAVVAYQL